MKKVPQKLDFVGNSIVRVVFEPLTPTKKELRAVRAIIRERSKRIPKHWRDTATCTGSVKPGILRTRTVEEFASDSEWLIQVLARTPDPTKL